MGAKFMDLCLYGMSMCAATVRLPLCIPWCEARASLGGTNRAFMTHPASDPHFFNRVFICSLSLILYRADDRTDTTPSHSCTRYALLHAPRNLHFFFAAGTAAAVFVLIAFAFSMYCAFVTYKLNRHTIDEFLASSRLRILQNVSPIYFLISLNATAFVLEFLAYVVYAGVVRPEGRGEDEGVDDVRRLLTDGQPVRRTMFGGAYALSVIVSFLHLGSAVALYFAPASTVISSSAGHPSNPSATAGAAGTAHVPLEEEEEATPEWTGSARAGDVDLEEGTGDNEQDPHAGDQERGRVGHTGRHGGDDDDEDEELDEEPIGDQHPEEATRGR